MKRTFFLLFVYIYLTIEMVCAQVSNTTSMPVMVRIPSFSLVDFVGTGKRIFFVSGTELEQIITPTTHDKTWLNYSSIVEGNSTNVISVYLSHKNLPAEISIKLFVGEHAGTGGGKLGKPIGPITLTSYPQDIIVDIGSCYTGRGIHKGHQLTYSWEWLSPYNIDQSTIENIEIAVTYTIIAK
ncbi:MAG: hypothetical protein Q7J05_00050 [Paludibacter sp.]|nr:hypothetical protein [Paludibacter sp.]